MPNVSNFAAQTDNAVVQGTVTDRAMVIPDIPPQGLMSVGPRVTPNFVNPSLWSALTTYHFFDVVRDTAGASYVAIKPEVPAGTEVTDEGYWFLWANPNSQFAELSELVKTFNGRISQNTADIATKAPHNHASEDTTYGVGNETGYGHVRLAAGDTPLTSGENDGIAATPAFLSQTLSQALPQALSQALPQALSQALPLASAKGFSSDQASAHSNVELFNSLNEPIYIDIDVTIDEPLHFTPTKYMTGRGKISYTGPKTSNALISMDQVRTGTTALRGAVIDLTLDCLGNSNGVSWHGGIYTEVKMTVFNPAETGISIMSNDSDYMPSYGNDYSLKVHTYNLIEGPSVGVSVNASDDNYLSVECGNFKNSLIVNRGNNTFGYIHGWVAKPELFDESTCVEIKHNDGTGSSEIATIQCDTMMYGLKISNAARVNVNYIHNFWSTGSAPLYIGTDRPFIIESKCEVLIDTVNWMYKKGTFDSTTGLSNCNLSIMPNDKYVTIVKCNGLSFIGDISNAPTCNFRMMNTNDYTKKYTNTPSSFVEATDNNTLAIILFAEQNPLIRRYIQYSSKSNDVFIAQTYRGNNKIEWKKLTLTDV